MRNYYYLKLLHSKIIYIKKPLILKNCFKLPKRGNHKKYGIGSFHIHVQYLYIKSNFKKVAQKL